MYLLGTVFLLINFAKTFLSIFQVVFFSIFFFYRLLGRDRLIEEIQYAISSFPYTMQPLFTFSIHRTNPQATSDDVTDCFDHRRGRDWQEIKSHCCSSRHLVSFTQSTFLEYDE